MLGQQTMLERKHTQRSFPSRLQILMQPASAVRTLTETFPNASAIFGVGESIPTPHFVQPSGSAHANVRGRFLDGRWSAFELPGRRG